MRTARLLTVRGMCVQGCLCPGRMLRRGKGCPEGCVCPGGVTRGVCVQGKGVTRRCTPPPPVNRMTGRCKTLPSRNFVCERWKKDDFKYMRSDSYKWSITQTDIKYVYNVGSLHSISCWSSGGSRISQSLAEGRLPAPEEDAPTWKCKKLDQGGIWGMGW